MSVKANWHLADLDLPTADPMAISALQAAPVIELDGERAKITATLHASLKRESNYQRMFGLSCDMKWTVDGGDASLDRNPCRSCPHFTADDQEERSLLCLLGREQEDIIDAFYLTVAAAGLEDAFLAPYEAEFDSAHELAEAVL